MNVPRSTRSLAALAVLASIGAAASDASACGGTFCDIGPRAMPVDQTGENILFVLDGKSVEAHVQIQYKGDPARFAWVVPMPAVPTVTVGSEQLFDSVLQATVPSFGFSTQRDFCAPPFGFGGATGAGGAAAFLGIDAGAGGVTVLFKKTVGAFEVTALTGHSSTEVVDWLSTNGYQGAAAAPAILDKYVAKGSVFVAVKLTAGAGTSQIHPLVFKYAGTEPCIPLQLTAIAAVEDMGVRAFFLGDDRVVSTNYGQVTLNPARFDWSKNVANYNDVVSRAVDETAAGGHAFVTEYAGASNIVPAYNLTGTAWDETAFVGIDPRDLVDELSRQGLISCYQGSPSQCTPQHPLILPLLHEFLPPPAGVDDGTFYSCVQCNLQDGAVPAFDSAAFETALVDRVFTPGRHAAALLQRWPYLTRLFTTISPSEMTDDPLFEARSDLPQYSPQRFATQRIASSGASGFTLPDGRIVATPNGTWPPFSSAMPWAEKIEQFPAGQKPVKVLADNTAAIDGQLDKWNLANSWPAPPIDCTSVQQGAGGVSIDGGGVGPLLGAGGTGSGGFVTTPSNGPRNSDVAPAPGASGGCSVVQGRGAESRAPTSVVLSAIAALVVARRRRRLSVQGACPRSR